MARFLFAVWPSEGHVNPGLPIAKHLMAHGHEVLFYTSSFFEEKVRGAGVPFAPFKRIRNFSGSTLAQDFPHMPNYEGIKKLKWGIRHIIGDTTQAWSDDLDELRERFKPDALVVCPTFTGIIPIRLRGDRIKIACFGILPLSLTSVDTAPFGLSILPKDSPMGRLRNRALNFFVQKVAFATEQRHFNGIMKRMGLPKLKHYFFDLVVHYSDLYLQGTCPSFEYPRRDLPPQVRFVGPYNAKGVAKGPLPDWWPDLESGKPVVHVTQGTLQDKDFSQLVEPAIKALANKDVLVVVTTGNQPVSKIGIPLPPNVRVEQFIPYAALMPHVDVMVTNGGYGGVQYALQYGVPLIVAGDSEDKPEVACRVEWAGAGINLRTGSPTVEQIGSAVHALLTEPKFKQRAVALQKELDQYDAFEMTVRYLEELVAADQAGFRHETMGRKVVE